MIGLLFLFGIGLWLIVAFVVSVNIPRWLGTTKHHTATVLLSFPLVLIAPFADEIIGRWQFKRLCEREAVVTLSPDWETVKRAYERKFPTIPIDGNAIPIRVQQSEYVDIETGRPFLTFKAFHTNGGILFGQLGLGLGQTTSCWPRNLTKVMNEVNTDRLMKNGKTK